MLDKKEWENSKENVRGIESGVVNELTLLVQPIRIRLMGFSSFFPPNPLPSVTDIYTIVLLAPLRSPFKDPGSNDNFYLFNSIIRA